MGLNSLEIANMAREFEKSQPVAPTSKSTQARVKVRAASGVKIGDQINGKTVTGLGKFWVETVLDHDSSAWGLEPGRDHRVQFQYAYCK